MFILLALSWCHKFQHHFMSLMPQTKGSFIKIERFKMKSCPSPKKMTRVPFLYFLFFFFNFSSFCNLYFFFFYSFFFFFLLQRMLILLGLSWCHKFQLHFMSLMPQTKGTFIKIERFKMKSCPSPKKMTRVRGSNIT